MSPASDFARAFPTLASHLATPGSDPSVERIVEGLEELVSKLHRLVDAASPHAALHFAELLFPELLRPFPAATILELEPNGALAHEHRVIAAGAEFESVSVNGTRCRFRAHSAFPLSPWRVDDARLSWSSSEGQALDVALVPLRRGASSQVPPLFPLRLHLASEPRSALTVLAWLDQRLARVELRVGEAVHELPTGAVVPWGYHRDDALLPPDEHEHPGWRLLRELFILPAKFAFVDVVGVTPPIRPGEAVSLRFRFATPLPTSVRLDRDAVRTNCVPVANVFSTTTEPLRPSLERRAEVLRPAGIAPACGEIYAVRRAVALLQGGGTAPVAAATRFGGGEPGALVGVAYSLERAPAPGGGTRLQLALDAAPDAPDVPAIDVLSLDAWATNRELPAALGVGDVRVSSALSPAFCTFRNIAALSTHREAPRGSALRWRTLALLAAGTRSPARLDTVRTLVHALNLHPLADEQAARAHAQRLGALLTVETTPARQLLSHGVALGHDVLVRLAGAGFDGEGEAFLLGRVLAQLFAHEAAIGAFARTRILLADTGATFQFPAMNGDEVLG